MPGNFSQAQYSRTATQETFNRLKRRFKNGSWLGVQNRYAKDCINRIDKDCRPPGLHRINGARGSQLAEYIAASVPLHCIDGWSFLGKAIISHAIGDTEACKHFSYYAQLRAVMSLLASEGVGVFNMKHFSITSADGRSSSIHGPISNRTHELVRTQFTNWINENRSGGVFQKIIRPRGIELATWFSEISTSPLNYLAKDWLKQWNYDIKTLGLDQSARNSASYRPTAISRDHSFRNSVQIRESLDIVENIWRMCMADGIGGAAIDKFLLRLSWTKYLGRRPTQAEAKLVLENMGISEPELTSLTNLLSYTSHPDDPKIIIEAGKKGKSTDNDYHIQMMARATLLLRLATGSGMYMIEEAHFSKDDLKFWWEPFGENYGLWESGHTDPISDMWAEIESALGEMAANSSGVNNHYEWRTKFATELLALSGCERIALSQFCI